MKTINDYTDEELLALPEEKVEYIIDLMCAQRGVPLLPPKPVAPVQADVNWQPDLPAYRVGADAYVTDVDVAWQVEALLSKAKVFTQKYLKGPGFKQGLRPYGKPVTISAEYFYSDERWEAISGAMSSYEEKKAHYEELKKEYDTAFSAREEVISEVQERLTQAERRKQRRTQARVLFGRYYELAEGNTEIALAFLAQSGAQVDDEVLEELRAYPSATAVVEVGHAR